MKCAGMVWVLTLVAIMPAAQAASGVEPLITGAYGLGFEVMLPGSPEVICDVITGDISGWWDHSFSPQPHRLYIEPKQGGGFLRDL